MNATPLVEALLAVLGVYLAIGLLVAIPFAVCGAKRIDPSAAEGTWGFKLLIIPGAMLWWPVLLRRWIGKRPPPTERSAHRQAVVE